TTEITIQDLYDTLRSIEERMRNLEDDSLISAGGKEDLGGGVFVGVSATLRNSQLQFEARHIELSTGTAESGSSQTVLFDSTATFIADNVARGDLVINHTDSSSTSVLSVDGEDQLTVQPLVGGSDNNFDIGDAYDVFDIVQCNVSGGNIVAIDDVGAPLNPIFPSFATQVIRTSSSSATLQELEDIQFASFEGGVTIDVVDGISGTAFPIGTTRQPVNNFNDALTIAADKGLNRIFVRGNATLSSGDFSNFEVIGQSLARSVITVQVGAIVTGTEFFDTEITGIFSGDIRFKNCFARDISVTSGIIENCLLSGVLALSGTAVTHILECRDAQSGAGTPTIDLGGAGHELNMRNYIGGVTLRNKSGTETAAIDLQTGRVILESTVTNGNVRIRGIGTLED
ncbi:hypothetical protein LCGC14_2842850, partial [marine sediment metagenome]